jgi:2-amino-4-hydroxy-6-hydroxymethyldihydropteridine diphosphokinase
MARVYLSLGSNLGDSLALLRQAIHELRAVAEIRLVDTSRLYETEPWKSEPGQTSPRWYLNCAVAIETTLAPDRLLDRLQGIEQRLGRTREARTPEASRFQPRTMDIDILFYDTRVVSVPDRVHIPHLLAHEREFVLRPLADLAPELEHPIFYQTIRQLLDALEDPHTVRPTNHPLRWFD